MSKSGVTFTKTSVKQFQAKFGAAIKKMDDNVKRGLMRGGVIVRGKSMKMTPVDTGNLIGSMYGPIVVRHTKSSIAVEVGYTAKYAPAVHEMPGTLKGQPRRHFGRTGAGVEFGGGTGKGNYWDPAGEPKFLEKAILSSQKEIMEEIRKAIKL